MLTAFFSLRHKPYRSVARVQNFGSQHSNHSSLKHKLESIIYLYILLHFSFSTIHPIKAGIVGAIVSFKWMNHVGKSKLLLLYNIDATLLTTRFRPCGPSFQEVASLPHQLSNNIYSVISLANTLSLCFLKYRFIVACHSVKQYFYLV